MYKFSKRSRENLATCHIDLQRIFNQVIKFYDCSVLCGHRSETDQEKAFDAGYSKLHYPDSKHNTSPSMAVDVVPFPVLWSNKEHFIFFAGIVHSVALQMGHEIRYGVDFNRNLNFTDDKLFDGPHFELIG